MFGKAIVFGLFKMIKKKSGVRTTSPGLGLASGLGRVENGGAGRHIKSNQLENPKLSLNKKERNPWRVAPSLQRSRLSQFVSTKALFIMTNLKN